MKTSWRLLLLAGISCMFTGVSAQNLRPEANEKGKFGYVDEQGKKVISYKYTEAYPFEEGLAKVRRGDKYGFIDPDGKAVGKIKYTLILPFTGSFCRVAVGGTYKDGILKGAKWGFLNKRGEEILLPVYDEIGEFEEGVTYVLKGKKYGLIDEHAKFLLEPKYVAVGKFDQFGHCWFAVGGKVNKKTGRLSNARYGVVNRDGDIIIPAKYATLGYFYRYRTKGGAGMVDCNATLSNKYSSYALQRPLSRLYDPSHYYWAELASLQNRQAADSLKNACENLEFLIDGNYLFCGKTQSRFGVMDTHGDVLVPERKFDQVFCPSGGVALVSKFRKKKDEQGYYNVESGYLKTFSDDEQLFSYVDGLGKVQNKKNRSAYFVDRSGNRVTDVYRMAFNFEDGLCIVQDEASGKFGVIGTDGKDVLPFEYDNVKTYFKEGYLGVCQAGKWGFVDRAGKVVIPLTYANVTNFGYGWACVQDQKQRWGMIDKDNRVVLPVVWNNLKMIEEANPAYIWGKDGDFWYCYNMKSKKLAFTEGFEDAANFKDGFAYVKQDGKYGMINEAGGLVVPCKMDSFARLENALAYMKKLGKASLDDTDAFRLNIYEDPSVNAYQITDKIPVSKWDY